MKFLNKIIFLVLIITFIPVNSFAEQQGRFQIVINPSMRTDTFLLDTLTGKVWKQSAITDADNEVVWLYMDKIDSLKELQGFPDKHAKKESAATDPLGLYPAKPVTPTSKIE